MERMPDKFASVREQVAESLDKLNGFRLLTSAQQKLVRVALQMRAMYPSEMVFNDTEVAIMCYHFVDRVEKEMTLSTDAKYVQQFDEGKTAFAFRSEELTMDGRGRKTEIIDSVRKFGYPAVVTFGVPSQILKDTVNMSHILVVLGEVDGEPIVINKDATYPFELVPLSKVISYYDDGMFTHRPNWKFGIRKLHSKAGIIEPQIVA